MTEHGARPATTGEVVARAVPADADLILCGHTHIPRAVQLPDGRLVVNPGSVGLPAYEDTRPYPHAMETGTPHARYATVCDDGGRWSVSFHAVPYDWEEAARKAESQDRPDWARALRTGRA